jgi:hypothetical protein
LRNTRKEADSIKENMDKEGKEKEWKSWIAIELQTVLIPKKKEKLVLMSFIDFETNSMQK